MTGWEFAAGPRGLRRRGSGARIGSDREDSSASRLASSLHGSRFLRDWGGRGRVMVDEIRPEERSKVYLEATKGSMKREKKMEE